MAAQFRAQVSGLYGGIRSYAHRLPQHFGRTTLADANRPIAMAANNPQLTSESGMALKKPLFTIGIASIAGIPASYMASSVMTPELMESMFNNSSTIAGIAAGVGSICVSSLAVSIYRNMGLTTKNAEHEAAIKGQKGRIAERDTKIRTLLDKADEKNEEISELRGKPEELENKIQELNAQLAATALSELGKIKPQLMADMLMPIIVISKEKLHIADRLSYEVIPAFVGNEEPQARGEALARCIYKNPDIGNPSTVLSWLYKNTPAWRVPSETPAEWREERVQALLARAKEALKKLKPGDAKGSISIYNLIVSAREENAAISKEDQPTARSLFEQSRDLVLHPDLAKLSDECERSLWYLISLSPMKAFPELSEKLGVKEDNIGEAETKRSLGSKMAKYEVRLTGKQALNLRTMAIPGITVEECGAYCVKIEAKDKDDAIEELLKFEVPKIRIRASKTRGTVEKSKIPANELEQIKGIFKDPKADVLEFKSDITKDQIDELNVGEQTKEILHKAHNTITLLAELTKEEAEKVKSKNEITNLSRRLITVPASEINDAMAALTAVRVPEEAIKKSETIMNDDTTMIWAELSGVQEKALNEMINSSVADPQSAKFKIAGMRIKTE